MSLAPSVAEVVLLKVAVMVVALVTTTLLIEKPAAEPATLTVDPGTKFVPVKVTFMDVPRSSKLGEIDVSVGAGGATTVKSIGPRVPPGVTPVSFLAGGRVFEGMVQ